MVLDLDSSPPAPVTDSIGALGISAYAHSDLAHSKQRRHAIEPLAQPCVAPGSLLLSSAAGTSKEAEPL